MALAGHADASAPDPLPNVVRERKRRMPNAAEQARRVAWGKQYGQANKQLYERAKQEAS